MQVFERHALRSAVGDISLMFNGVFADFSDLPKATDCGVILYSSACKDSHHVCAKLVTCSICSKRASVHNMDYCKHVVMLLFLY